MHVDLNIQKSKSYFKNVYHNQVQCCWMQDPYEKCTSLHLSALKSKPLIKIRRK